MVRSALPAPSCLQPVGTGEPERHDLHFEDVGLVSLHALNITKALELGIRLSQDAIRQVLTGGTGPLGERDRTVR